MDVRAHLAQFGELAVRDYLRSKGLEKTMAAFDDELSAARAAGGAGVAGAPSVDAWYSISRALDLPDLLHANSLAAERRYETILEVLLHELLQETNLKMRRPASLAVQRPNAPGAGGNDPSRGRSRPARAVWPLRRGTLGLRGGARFSCVRLDVPSSLAPAPTLLPAADAGAGAGAGAPGAPGGAGGAP